MIKFENLLDKISFTSQDVEKEIMKNDTISISYRNNKVEWKIRMPSFINSFYSFCISNQRIPSQQEFLDFYLEENPNFKTFYSKQDSEFRFGVMSRVFRAYYSLIRDIHMCLSLKDKKDFKVIYNLSADEMLGIDILIEKQKRMYGFNLFINTKNSLEARKKKERRHTININTPSFDIPISFNESKIVIIYTYILINK